MLYFSGSNFLQTTTFMHITKQEPVDIETTSLAYECGLWIKDEAALSKTMDEVLQLPKDHQLRSFGRNQLKKRAEVDLQREANDKLYEAKKQADKRCRDEVRISLCLLLGCDGSFPGKRVRD